VDELALGNWLFVSANTPDNADPPQRPKPLPRPGDEEQDTGPVSATPEQIAAFFGAGGGT
jgi:hypothetical protein